MGRLIDEAAVIALVQAKIDACEVRVNWRREKELEHDTHESPIFLSWERAEIAKISALKTVISGLRFCPTVEVLNG